MIISNRFFHRQVTISAFFVKIVISFIIFCCQDRKEVEDSRWMDNYGWIVDRLTSTTNSGHSTQPSTACSGGTSYNTVAPSLMPLQAAIDAEAASAAAAA